MLRKTSNTSTRRKYCSYCGGILKKYLTIEETAKVLKCSVEKIRRLVKSRKLGFKRVGRQILIPADEIERLGTYYPAISDL